MEALFIFFNGRPPPPLHLQSMVGRNGLFSVYKSQRTKGHRGTVGKKKLGQSWEFGLKKMKEHRTTRKNKESE
jgi:hypothetical protein